MLLAIISAILAYRKAKDTGRNAWLWAFIAAAVFIGTQFVVALVVGLGLGIYLAATGGDDSAFEKLDIPIRIVAVIFSFATTWLVLRYLDKAPQTESFSTPPPPPENFN